MGTGMKAYDSSGSVATLRAGIPCDFCGAEIPLGRKHGSERRFCSDKCRRDSWDARNPRLPFPKPKAPATGEPYESARLWLLARLQQGPVCTLELRREPWPASLNPAQRVLELRNRQYRIKTERREGKTYYRLEQEG